jgi:hypothetical protein
LGNLAEKSATNVVARVLDMETDEKSRNYPDSIDMVHTNLPLASRKSTDSSNIETEGAEVPPDLGEDISSQVSSEAHAELSEPTNDQNTSPEEGSEQRADQPPLTHEKDAVSLDSHRGFRTDQKGTDASISQQFAEQLSTTDSTNGDEDLFTNSHEIPRSLPSSAFGSAKAKTQKEDEKQYAGKKVEANEPIHPVTPTKLSAQTNKKLLMAEQSKPPVQEDSRGDFHPPGTIQIGNMGRRSSEVTSMETPFPTGRVSVKRQQSADHFEDVSLISDAREFPRQIEFKSEFDVNYAVEDWEDAGPSVAPYVPSMNCPGVVHVRLLRAQRLPCPVGSSVQAILSLPPWKGRIRLPKVKSFAGSRRSGVCTDWSDDDDPVSMVHAYSSAESPVPSIRVRIVFATLGMFEFGMCSLEISCERLLREPMKSLVQWFRTVPEGGERSLENIPLVQMEAMFEPEDRTFAGVPKVQSPKRSIDESLLETSSSPLVSVATSTAQSLLHVSQHQTAGEQRLHPVAEAKVSIQATPSRKGGLVAPTPSPSQRRSAVDDKSDLSVSVMSRKAASTLSTKSHLLRTRKFYTPARCSVCGKSIMSGVWKASSFRCEECGIDCCGDCRLHVDIQLPCGSTEAEKAVHDAAEAQFTSEKILQWVAPVEKPDDGAPKSPLRDKPGMPSRLSEHEPGIGKLKFMFAQACALANAIPSHFSLDFDNVDSLDLKSGDYYVRVVRLDGNGTVRTKTVQQSTRPQFESSEIVVSVPSFSSAFRVELVDAVEDVPVGFLLLTTQMLLQEQRDEALKRLPLPLPHFKFPQRRIVRELRRFVKDGGPREYFPDFGARYAGEVVGLIEFHVVLEEDFSALYGSYPYKCPPRPTDDLDLGKLRHHMERISQLIVDLGATLHLFGYITSWENPVLTFTSFLAFSVFCYKVHPDYFFAGPVFLLIVYMAYLAFLRVNNGLKIEYQEREINARKKRASILNNRKFHRPVGKINVVVKSGKNIRSPEMGLPGSVSCRVSIDFGRGCSDRARKELSKVDGAVEAPHCIGTTETVFAANPIWQHFEESEESKRLKYVVPSQDGFFEDREDKRTLSSLDFPVLKPVAPDRLTKEVELRPWSESKAAVIFEVVFHDFANIIPGSEYCVGEVVIPLRQLVQEREMKGWFKLSTATNTEPAAAVAYLRDEEHPAIDLEITWLPPTKVHGLSSEVEWEASLALQEELVRAAKHAKKGHIGFVGTSLGAIDTIRGVRGYLLAVQNGLGTLLDVIEASKNLFNFADPAKSFVIISALCIAWLTVYHIPFRLLVFSLGSVPYLLALNAKRIKMTRRGKKKKRPTSEQDSLDTRPTLGATWILNFLRGIPVDEDLKQTYFWDVRRKATKLIQEEADQRRSSRLQKLWHAQWYENVEMLKRENGTASSPASFESCFAVLIGRRFMIWKSPEVFDTGEKPIAKVFLQGHAGLSTPSPIELKAIGSQARRAVSIFGRGAQDQYRITILTSGSQSKKALECAVDAALNTKYD